MSLDDVTVRVATRDDMPAVLRMIHELAQFEGVPEGPQLTLQGLLEDGFDSSPPCFMCWVAVRGCGGDGGGGDEGGGEVVGHALVNRAYSSWTRRALYIEDLYVRPACRRARVGLKLFKAIAQWCVCVGVSRVDWHVLSSNAGALAFYAGLGARDVCATEGRAALRLDATHIQRLAQADAHRSDRQ